MNMLEIPSYRDDFQYDRKTIDTLEKAQTPYEIMQAINSLNAAQILSVTASLTVESTLQETREVALAFMKYYIVQEASGESGQGAAKECQTHIEFLMHLHTLLEQASNLSHITILEIDHLNDMWAEWPELLSMFHGNFTDIEGIPDDWKWRMQSLIAQHLEETRQEKLSYERQS